jgi:putative protease
MGKRIPSKAELTAPAGSYESLMAAIKAGADSVYFGVQKLNMRAHAADNFTLKDLRKISNICRKHGIRSYLTLNTILYDQDLRLMKKICDSAKKAGISAIVASDIAALSYAHSANLEVHASTQLNISNIEAVKFYAQFADTMVLARELTLSQIKKICSEIRNGNICGPKGKLMQVELFVHGALCLSIAGKCYMSLATYNMPANRGCCLQNCRRAYRLIDEETGDELLISNKYILSPKDLCTIGFIDKILDAGVSVLKIEGRGRSPEYVYVTTKAYREALDSYYSNTYTKEKVKKWTKQLESVFNRGFWHGGYYLGKKLGEWSGVYGSKSTKEKVFLGIAKNYFGKKKIAEFVLQSGALEVGDEVLVTGPTTGVVMEKVKSIFKNNRPVKLSKKGDTITIPIPEKIRKNDKLFLIKEKRA